MSRFLRLRLPVALAALVIVLSVPLVLVGLYRPDDAPPEGPAQAVREALAPEPVSAAGIMRQMAARPVVEKVQPLLREALEAGEADELTLVTIQSTRKLDMRGVSDRYHQFRWPAGEHVTIAWVRAEAIERLGARQDVARVQWTDPDHLMTHVPELPLVDPDVPSVLDAPPAGDPAVLRQMYAQAPTWAETQALLQEQAAERARLSAQATTASGSAQPQGWFDSRWGHAAQEAWDLGYTGEGVKVAVIDTSTDFGHPDLHEAWATYGEGHMFEGWPHVWDPIGAQNLMLDEMGLAPDDRVLTTELQTVKSDVIRMQQSITVTAGELAGRDVYTGCLQSAARFMVPNPNNPNQRVPQTREMEPACNYIFPESQSGTVHFGWHHDWFAGRAAANPEAQPDPIQAEYPGVLLIDPNEAGVYDTVYIDLDLDHDFTNDKPMTKDSPLGWRDVTGDGIADLSGGLLYWIADGQMTFPGGWLFGYDGVPDAAKYVAIHTDINPGGHGTLCGSNIASRGNIGVPDEIDLSYRDLPGDGKPNPFNPGMAPDAELVAIGWALGSLDQAWRFALLGADVEDPSDDVQITSNSYGNSGADDEGWNNSSRMGDYYIRTFNPNAVALFSTGNGGPGYGTIASPVPATSMNIAASTQMGSTGWDSVFETSQITFGDITPFSNRGPSATGFVGPHVATDGAFAGGARLINTITTAGNRAEAFRGGDHGNGTWGGTSRSSPIAAGLLANVYQAFRAEHDRWPTWREVRAIAMAAGRFNGYDVMTAGAGVLDGGDAVRIAAGVHGIYADPPEWTAGDYRGTVYEAFPKLIEPGSADAQSFTLTNHADEPVDVTLSTGELRRIDMHEMDFTTNVVSEETEYAFASPDYFIELQRARVPEGTDLMEVEWILPLDEVDLQVTDDDPDGNQTVESYWRMGVYQHTDWNDDQLLWDDADGDGHVDKALSDDISNVIDGNGGATRRIDWENSEIQEGEYMRFSYNSNAGNNQAVYVHHPLERWSSGVFVGLWHHGSGRNDDLERANFKIRVTYYDYETWPLMSLSGDSVTVPGASAAGPGTAVVTGTMTVPEDAPYGVHQGAIFADYARLESDPPVPGPGGWEHPEQRVVIPVAANVAPRFTWDGPLVFGGADAVDPDAPYSNGSVSGRQSYTWRAESGDWRFFFFDVTPPPAGWGSQFLVQTAWDDPSMGQTDIDSRLYGPASDPFSDPDHPGNQEDEDGVIEDKSDPDFFGPQTMRLIGQSPRTYINGGRWPFNTQTGDYLDLVSGTAVKGLHELMLDNVLFSGQQFRVPFTSTIGSIRWAPELPVLVGEECTTVTIESDFDFEDVQVKGYGFTNPITATGTVTQTADQGDPSVDSWTFDFSLPSEAPILTVTLEGPGDGNTDLDLYVLYDADGDGVFEDDEERVMDGRSPTDSEFATASAMSPAGDYQVWVHGWQVAGEASFDLTVHAVYGEQMSIDQTAIDLSSDMSAELRVCGLDVAQLEGGEGGIIRLSLGSGSLLTSLPVQWRQEGWTPAMPSIYLPALKTGVE